MISTRIFSKAFAAGSVALGLLLGASAVQAADVVIENGNVIRINDLELNLDNDELDGFYDVEFVYSAGNILYGTLDPEFDLPPEELGIAIVQINNALNLNDPVPTGATTAGQDRFYIPAEQYIAGGSTRLFVAYGSEYVAVAQGWEACETGDCRSGIAILDPDVTNPYARIIPTDGVPDEWNLTVVKDGEGSGTVTSSPSGIDCGDTCAAAFNDGASVTLTATPDDGSVFISLRGCDVAQPDGCILSMTEDRNVTATFGIGGDSKNTGFLPAVVDVILE